MDKHLATGGLERPELVWEFWEVSPMGSLLPFRAPIARISTTSVVREAIILSRVYQGGLGWKTANNHVPLG